jgi:hypothetical protein
MKKRIHEAEFYLKRFQPFFEYVSEYLYVITDMTHQSRL